MSKLFFCFLFLSFTSYANDNVVKMKMEPARLVAYELEDRFDDFNETLKKKTGLFSGFIKPNTIYVELTYYGENKEFSPFAKSKTDFWISEIIKKYGIKKSDFVLKYHDVVLD